MRAPIPTIRHSRRAAVITAAATAFALAAGSYAFAAIPGNDGVITGCYDKSSGQFRIIDAAKSCSRSETRIGWNQTGVQGVPGATGAPGSPGVDGVDGVVPDQSCPSGQFVTGVLGGALTCDGPQMGLSSESEPNDTDATANQLPSPSGSRVSASGWSGDTDLYRVDVKVGNPMAVSTGGDCATSEGDTYLRVTDGGGAPFAQDDNSSVGGCSFVYFRAFFDATYYIEVSTPESFTTPYHYTLNVDFDDPNA